MRLKARTTITVVLIRMFQKGHSLMGYNQMPLFDVVSFGLVSTALLVKGLSPQQTAKI